MKRAFYALFFFILPLVSCNRCPPAWNIESSCERTCWGFKKIKYADANICKNLEVELIKSPEGLRMYFSILSIPLRSRPDGSGQVECTLTFQDSSSSKITLERLEGGQRFLVSETDMFTMIERLWDGEPIIVKLGRYEGTLECGNFRKAYRDLLSCDSCDVKVHWSSFYLR